MPITVIQNNDTVEIASRNDVVNIASPAGSVVDMRSVVVNGLPYSGPYEVTPSGEQQVLSTMFTTPSQNIVINPIPSNYGLVTWNGSALTIS